MGGADIPCELCGEFSSEFDGMLDIKADLEETEELEDSQEDLEVQKSIRILKEITPIASSDRPPPAPKDRLVAFEKRPLHLLSPHADRDFTIFAALTRSGEQIYDNGWLGGEESKICSKPSSPKSCPAKNVIALSSKEGAQGAFAGALSIPGTSATSTSYDSPWIAWTFSDALSMFCSITKRSPQAFYAAVQWSTAFNGDKKQNTRIDGEIGDNWNSDDYFDAGPIVRSQQYPNLLDYVLRGYQRPYVCGGPEVSELEEEVKHRGTHPSLYRFKRAIDGKIGAEGLHELDDENYDIALWEYWNDYGNMHNFALRSLFPIKGAYKLRKTFFSAFTSTNLGNLNRSTSKLESLPIEVLLHVLSSSSITPLDFLSLGGASHRLRSILVEGGRVDSLTKSFIQRSAPWLLPNTTDWWDSEGYEDYDKESETRDDGEFFEFYKLSLPEHLRGDKMRVQKKRERDSTEQKIWKDWIKEAEVESITESKFQHNASSSSSFEFPSNFPWLAYYLLSTSTRRTKFGRETNYAYSSSMRNRKRVYHIIKNIEKLIEEVEIDPKEPLNVDSLERFKRLSDEGKERFRSWPEGTPRPDFGQFLTY